MSYLISYIISYHIYHIVSHNIYLNTCHIVSHISHQTISYHIVSYIISYQIIFYMKVKIIFDSISFNSSYNDNCFSQMWYRRSKHKHYIQFLFAEYRVVFEIMWKTMEPDRTHMTIQHGASAFIVGYLRLQTHTQNKYVIIITFPRK